MSKVSKNINKRDTELKHRMMLVEIAAITFLLATLVRRLGLCCSKRGLDWDSCEIGKVEVLENLLWNSDRNSEKRL